MKHVLRIPTAEQYAYIETEVEGTAEEAFEQYQKLTNVVRGKAKNNFEKVLTFTDEIILYDPVAHRYTDLEGNTLIGGSAYKASLEAPFDLNRIAPMTAKKHGVKEDDIRDMWKRNGQISSGLGTALHAAMEQWFRHREHGTEKNYHLPKHPFLKTAVETFPHREANALPEVFVSDIANKRVGQIDLLVIDNELTQQGRIIDYKSDADITKNIDGHFNQLSFYAHILMAKGWIITDLEIWNYTDNWYLYTSPVLELKTKGK